MMPIFFHAESHLWIAYLFFTNGFLLNYCLATRSSRYRALVNTFEAQVVFAFCLSVALNGALLLVADWFNVAWSRLGYALLAISLLSVIGCVRGYQSTRTPLLARITLARLALYSMVFVVLFLNGGLIEQISDAWWHMSLANKMSHAQSFSLELGHLDGISNRYYPPLWHGNLALATLLSGEPLSVLWNSLTAWNAVLKTMACYLFGLALSKDRRIAFFGAVLFFLLPGMGISYMRVSAWPSHVAYVFWFAAFYVTFLVLDKVPRRDDLTIRESVADVARSLGRQWVLLAMLALLLLEIFLVHQLEVVWYAVAMFVFCGSLCFYQALFDDREIENNTFLSTSVFVLGSLTLCALSAMLIVEKNAIVATHTDRLLAYSLPVGILTLSALAVLIRRRAVSLGLMLLTVAAILVSVDFRHVVSLFLPELALPAQGFRELPVLSQGLFGDSLSVPGWHLQLRVGLLYTGILSIPLALVLVLLKPSKLTIFLAATACIGFLFCVSPYLFQWLRDIMAYHSSWRIAVLIFAPLIWATAVVLVWDWVAVRRASTRTPVVPIVVLIALLSVLVFDAKFHFSSDVIQDKRQGKSAQRHWNLFYSQQYVFNDSSLKYRQDLDALREVLIADSTVLADISTSYYLAAALPVYVHNVQRHHAQTGSPVWRALLKDKHACYLDQAERKRAFRRFLSASDNESARENRPPLRYLVVNKDQVNLNMRNDCLSQRRGPFVRSIGDLAELVFDGDYLMVFELYRQS